MSDAAFQELLDEFLLEARERADECEALLLALRSGDAEARREGLAQIKRELHTLKGNSGMMGFDQLQRLAHTLEDQVEEVDLDDPELAELLENLDRLRRRLDAIGPDGEVTADVGEADLDEGGTPELGTSVRVPFARIDHLVEMLAETLIFRNRLSDAVAHARAVARGERDDGWAASIAAAVERLDEDHTALEKTLALFQDAITELGMVPLQILFRSLGRIVHDESLSEGKQVDFRIHGGDTPIDKTLLEVAGEALGHLVRNAVVHGIEQPDTRRARGKPATGLVEVTAAVEGGEVVIAVRDDGGGIDVQKVREGARGRFGDEVDRLDDEAIYQTLFEEGVSTRGGTDLSAGRGVGMAAVKQAVERRNGRIEIDSEPGRGSTFVLRLPLTASILRSLLVEVDDETYAVPMSAVAETLRFSDRDRHQVNHAHVLRWRGQVLPMLDLGFAFDTRERPRDLGYAVVIEAAGRRRALAADEIAGIRDIVVKGLDPIVGQPPGVAGSTILGDGRVIMILDPSSLVTLSPFLTTPR